MSESSLPAFHDGVYYAVHAAMDWAHKEAVEQMPHNNTKRMVPNYSHRNPPAIVINRIAAEFNVTTQYVRSHVKIDIDDINKLRSMRKDFQIENVFWCKKLGTTKKSPEEARVRKYRRRSSPTA
jgi:hypothetical protein